MCSRLTSAAAEAPGREGNGDLEYDHWVSFYSSPIILGTPGNWGPKKNGGAC